VIETVATPKQRGRRIGLLALLAAMIALGVTLMPMTAGAVHSGPFELDGNALADPNSAPQDDWGTLFPTDTSSTDLGHSFVTDKGESGVEPDDGYGSGLTKDTQDVPNWSAVTGAISPEKDDILHAYAATYVDGSDQLLYFGQDRAPKPNGSTSMGFWFFQDQVGPDGSGGFTGQHVDGDILITSDMTNGGSVSVVNIFRWQDGGIDSVASLANAECGESLSEEIEALGCAIANESGPIDVPWAYPSVDNPDQDVPQNIFFEGGINLTNLFDGQPIPCFSSFLANTRTSPSETADLKDFVTGTIDTCGTITIRKDATPKSAQTFSYETTGTGLSSFELADTTVGQDMSETKVFTGLTPGAYSVSEVNLALGWTNTDLKCTAEGPNTSVQKSGEATGRTASITLGLAGNVDCKFTNTFVKQNPSVTTDIHNTDHQTITSAPIGSPVHDQATVSGVQGFATPTGDVNFTVYTGNTQCEGPGTAAGSVALSDGVAHPSDAATVPVGGLSYKAHYNGDSIYNAADGPCETLDATKLDSSTATDVHNAGHQTITSAPIGSTVHDKATVTGTHAGGIPTGDVTFTVYMGNTQCEGPGAAAGTVALDGSGVAHPSNDATVPVGGLSYRAHYNGDDTYNESNGPCEPLAGDKLNSSTATDVHNADHDVITHAPIGSPVHDKAIVSGALTTPTGTVDFTVYMGNTQCEGPGTAAGSVALSYGVAHPSNDATVPVGGLSYRAHYNGDDTYNPSTGPCETLDATKLDSSTATDVHDADHHVITSAPIGSTVHDKATVTGALGAPTGTVDFTVFMGNTQCEGPGAAAGSVALSGGVAHPSNDATVPVGGLSYRAHYNGDDTYNPSTGPCETLNDLKGKLRVMKDFVNAPDEATVTLQIRHGEEIDESAQRGDGGLISKELAPGTYTAEEISGGGDVNLGLYNSSIKCIENGEGGEVVVPSTPGTWAPVELGNGDDITCTITNRHVLPLISVSKTPSPSVLQEPGGNVTYTITVTNTSSIDPIKITSLVDDKFGDLTAECGIPDAKWHLAPLASAPCTITRSVSGSPSSPHTNTVTATGHDEGGNQAQAQASATVTFTAAPPPPPAPPLIDLAVTKIDTPDPAKLNGQITYTMVVTNNGPDAATQVTVADSLPAGTSFVSVRTTQGTCANSGGLIQCSLGTIAKGGSVTITLVVKAMRPGVLTNEVTVVGKEPESNMANNRATATTLVPRPLIPPKPKPKVCSTLTVGTKTLRVGKRSTIAARVTNRGKAVKGAKVLVRGAGIAKSGRTNARGKARIVVRPARPGIVVVSVRQKLVCGSKRIGVVGVFEPPVTG
jgi:uncharacterized repeat protein (TIGR01451 family)